MALLGELNAVHGKVVVNGSTFYAAQEPWVLSITVQDNILFGNPFDAVWYNAGEWRNKISEPEMKVFPSHVFTIVNS